MATVATQIADYSVRLGEPALAVRWLDRALDEAGAKRGAPSEACRCRVSRR
jgi:hypothetical protein